MPSRTSGCTSPCVSEMRPTTIVTGRRFRNRARERLVFLGHGPHSTIGPGPRPVVVQAKQRDDARHVGFVADEIADPSRFRMDVMRLGPARGDELARARAAETADPRAGRRAGGPARAGRSETQCRRTGAVRSSRPATTTPRRLWPGECSRLTADSHCGAGPEEAARRGRREARRSARRARRPCRRRRAAAPAAPPRS